MTAAELGHASWGLSGELARVTNSPPSSKQSNSVIGVLYAFIQTPLANPNTAASNASKVIRMLGINPDTGFHANPQVRQNFDPPFADDRCPFAVHALAIDAPSYFKPILRAGGNICM